MAQKEPKMLLAWRTDDETWLAADITTDQVSLDPDSRHVAAETDPLFLPVDVKEEWEKDLVKREAEETPDNGMEEWDEDLVKREVEETLEDKMEEWDEDLVKREVGESPYLELRTSELDPSAERQAGKCQLRKRRRPCKRGRPSHKRGRYSDGEWSQSDSECSSDELECSSDENEWSRDEVVRPPGKRERPTGKHCETPGRKKLVDTKGCVISGRNSERLKKRNIPKPASFKCCICRKPFIEKELRKHVGTHFSLNPNSTSNNTVRCRVFLSQFAEDLTVPVEPIPTRSAVKLHDGPLECEECGKTFHCKLRLTCHNITPNDLQDQIPVAGQADRKSARRSVTKPRPLSSPRPQPSVQQHSSADAKYIVCRTCFSGKRHIDVLSQTHSIVHVLDTCFACSLCEKYFVCQEELNEHLTHHAENKEASVEEDSQIRSGTQPRAFARSCVCFECKMRKRCIKIAVSCSVKPKEVPMEERLFECSLCGERFEKDDATFSKHVRACSSLAKCSECSLECKNNTELSKHLRTAHPCVFPCDLCGRKQRGEKSLEAHRKAHVYGNNLDKTSLGHMCGEEYRNIAEHLCSCSTLVECSVCSLICAGKAYLLIHYRLAHPGQEVRGDDRADMGTGNKYLCHVCGQRIASKSSYKQHLRTHTAFRIFKCTQPNCNQRFYTADEAKKHALRPHNMEKRFACPDCDMRFRKAFALRNHSLVHAVDIVKPFVCVVCSKAFRRKSFLAKHFETHTRCPSDLCTCDVCGKQVTKSTIRDHVRTHMKETKNLPCTVCERVFRRPDTLKTHMRLHADAADRRFGCDECGVRFNHKCSLQAHKAKYSATNTSCAAAKHGKTKASSVK